MITLCFLFIFYFLSMITLCELCGNNLQKLKYERLAHLARLSTAKWLSSLISFPFANQSSDCCAVVWSSCAFYLYFVYFYSKRFP